MNLNLKNSTGLFFIILLAVLAAVAITAKVVQKYVESQGGAVSGNLNTIGAVASLFGHR